MDKVDTCNRYISLVTSYSRLIVNGKTFLSVIKMPRCYSVLIESQDFLKKIFQSYSDICLLKLCIKDLMFYLQYMWVAF